MRKFSEKKINKKHPLKRYVSIFKRILNSYLTDDLKKNQVK
jgi:hypothetical protein